MKQERKKMEHEAKKETTKEEARKSWKRSRLMRKKRGDWSGEKKKIEGKGKGKEDKDNKRKCGTRRKTM